MVGCEPTAYVPTVPMSANFCRRLGQISREKPTELAAGTPYLSASARRLSALPGVYGGTSLSVHSLLDRPMSG